MWLDLSVTRSLLRPIMADAAAGRGQRSTLISMCQTHWTIHKQRYLQTCMHGAYIITDMFRIAEASVRKGT